MSMKLLGGIAIVIAALAVLTVSILQEDDDEAPSVETDGAFVTEMVAHHESAIEMAEVAVVQAEHPEVRSLARSIIASQSDEIETFESIHERLFGEPIGEVDHGTMGLDEAGMGMDGSMSALERAKPFDREFIDMMIPHHQGAIEMARIELERGMDDEARAVAQDIIDAQSAEIEDMNAWRMEWYGEESPAGGVPESDSEAAPSHESMGH